MITLGKAVRLERMRTLASGRILTVAIDHAPSYGVLSGLETIQAVVNEVADAGPDAMVMMEVCPTNRDTSGFQTRSEASG